MATTKKRPEDLRSHRWFGVQDLRAFADIYGGTDVHQLIPF